MSYASRLVAMAGRVPAAALRPAHGLGASELGAPELEIDEVGEDPASVPSPVASRSAPPGHEVAPSPRRPTPAAPLRPMAQPSRTTPATLDDRAVRAPRSAGLPAALAPNQVATRTSVGAIDSVDSVDALDEADAPRVVPVISSPAPIAPSRAAAPSDWLAEHPDGADPLETLDADDDLRSLLRSVRAWTSSPVAGAEGPRAPALELAEPAVAIAPSHEAIATAMREPRRDDPMQVSIGNVLITVEDAPPSSGAGRPAPAPAVGDRLARHYLRRR
ncbi:MAG: hypothetical protein ACTHU0_11270 [Kofleriaceae bacterium]